MAFNTMLDLSVQLLAKHLGRGRVLMMPGCDYAVECKKHPTRWLPAGRLLSYSDHNDMQALMDALNAAFDSCPDCQEEALQVATRWPEGAEL